MNDLIFVGLTTIEVVLTVGFVIYCLRLVSFFGPKAKMGRAWIPMFLASLIILATGLVAFMQALQVGLVLPIWWRDFSALIFRGMLFVAVVVMFRSWKNLGKH